MVNPTNPFAGFDPMKLFDFERLASEMRRSGMNAVDMQALVDAQRRNLEALARANQVAADGMKALAQRQGEIMRQSMEQASAAMRDLMAASSPEEKAARQAEIAKAAFERAVANARDMADMVAKAQQEAGDVITKRMAAGMDEIKKMIENPGA
ncbi:MAG: phasin family protein [Alphaproteobacteria bacterium]|nr:phasin family protein [Alphaproteobacteria bacterium]